MRNFKFSAKVVFALIGLSTVSGCFLEDSVTTGIADGITGGLATVVEEFIISATPANEGE